MFIAILLVQENTGGNRSHLELVNEKESIHLKIFPPILEEQVLAGDRLVQPSVPVQNSIGSFLPLALVNGGAISMPRKLSVSIQTLTSSDVFCSSSVRLWL